MIGLLDLISRWRASRSIDRTMRDLDESEMNAITVRPQQFQKFEPMPNRNDPWPMARRSDK